MLHKISFDSYLVLCNLCLSSFTNLYFVLVISKVSICANEATSHVRFTMILFCGKMMLSEEQIAPSISYFKYSVSVGGQYRTNTVYCNTITLDEKYLLEQCIHPMLAGFNALTTCYHRRWQSSCLITVLSVMFVR